MAAFFTCLFVLISSGMAFADVPGNEVIPDGNAAQAAAESDSAAAPAEAEAQEANTPALVEAQPAAEPAAVQPIVAQPIDALPLVAQQESASINDYDWKSDSLKYKRIGWGLFGGGLLFAGVLGGALLGSAIQDNKELEGIGSLGHGIGNIIQGYVGIGAIALGGAVMFSGIGVLIAEAVKFNPYRRGEIAGLKFEWNPELYASPEFTGIGFSARF